MTKEKAKRPKVTRHEEEIFSQMRRDLKRVEAENEKLRAMSPGELSQYVKDHP